MNSIDKRNILILIAMTGSIAMLMVDQTVVGVALPDMQKDLNMSRAGMQWVVNAYLLSFASLLALGGRISDTIGRMVSFKTGVLMFALSSMLCGAAQSQWELIIGRVGQGIFAALMQPASAATVMNTFSAESRGRAMALYAGVGMAFMAVGPVLGGLLTQYLSWRWVFYINVPVSLATLLLTYIVKPDDSKNPEERIQLGGIAMFLLALPPIVLGLQQGHDWGWTSPMVLGLIGGGALVLTVFVVFELRSRNPLLHLAFFGSRAYLADALTLFCAQGAMICQIVFGAIYLQKVLGLSPTLSGVLIMIAVIPNIMVSQLAGRIYDRAGARKPLCCGTLIASAAMAYEAYVIPMQDVALFIPGLIGVGIGVGLITVPASTDGMAQAQPNMRGQANGLLQTVRQVGGSLGFALIGGLIGTMEQKHFESVLEKYDPVLHGHDEISAVAERVVEGFPKALMTVKGLAPNSVSHFTQAISNSFAAGYLFASVLLLLGFIAAFTLLRPRKTEKAEAES